MANVNTKIWKVLQAAKSAKTTRYAIQGIYSDGKHLVATNGRCMVVVAGYDLEPGYYLATGSGKYLDLVRNPDDNVSKFPKWQEVIPTETFAGRNIEPCKLCKGIMSNCIDQKIGIDFNTYWKLFGTIKKLAVITINCLFCEKDTPNRPMMLECEVDRHNIKILLMSYNLD